MPRISTLELRAELLRDARAIIEHEFSDDLQLDDVAARIATSRRQLQRVFTEIGGRSFRTELTIIRMVRAAELLAHTTLPVGEVARRVSYRQSAQFAKAFRAHHGTTPSAYRELRRHRHPTANGSGPGH